MKIITDYKDLVGKTIAYSHMAQFADQITLATTDGDILMVTFDLVNDEEELHIRMLDKYHVERELLNSNFLREDLAKVGAFDLNAYKNEQKRILEERKKAYAIEKRESDLKRLAELKAQYE